MPTITVLQLNGRKSNIAETKRDRFWDRRAPVMRKYLQSIRPTIWGGQEWTVDMCDDVMGWFPNLTYAGGVRFGNSAMFWDTTIMQAEEGTLLERKYPSDKVERYMNLIRLTHKESGHGVWLGSAHLAAGDPKVERNEAVLRMAQIKAMIADATKWTAEHPYPSDGTPNMVICADVNDYLPDNQGVRRYARDHGWKPLRTRIKSQGDRDLTTFTGDTYRSFNGWGKTSRLARDSKALDEIFTRGVSIKSAAIKRTCTDVYPICASDHNGYEALVNI